VGRCSAITQNSREIPIPSSHLFHLLFFASFLAHTTSGHKQRITGVDAVSGVRPIASEIYAPHDGSKGQFRPSLPYRHATPSWHFDELSEGRI